VRGFLVTRRRLGVDHNRMLELVDLVAVDEGGGIG
jgi:hypothetical protein